MSFSDEATRTLQRRVFLRETGVGLGATALGLLLARDGFGAPQTASPLAPKEPHFAPRAKNVIFLQMCGGPPQIDLFDPKPKLTELHNQPAPESLYKGQHFAFIKGAPKLLGCPYKFRRQGQSGALIIVLHQKHAHGPVQPCSGTDFHGHRFSPVRSSGHGIVDHLRAR